MQCFYNVDILVFVGEELGLNSRLVAIQYS